MDDLTTYLFSADASASWSDHGFKSGTGIDLFLKIAASGPSRVGTARASTIGGSKATGDFQITVHGKEMVPSPDCDPFAIRKAIIHSAFSYVP